MREPRTRAIEDRRSAVAVASVPVPGGGMDEPEARRRHSARAPTLAAALSLLGGACAYVGPAVPYGYPAAAPVDPTVASIGTGAAVGAAAGALVGSASGDAGTGALIGAGIGALGGYIAEQERRDRWEDWQRDRYYGRDWRYRSSPYPYYAW